MSNDNVNKLQEYKQPVRCISCIRRLNARCISISIIHGSTIKPDTLRNFGIVAHIDAGKTTTTECILKQTGKISRRGSVDRGDTVTDFTEEERQRGISIVAAAVAGLPWNSHSLNLIDTPGHVDFALEVERSLRVMDGAVLILDAGKGVQAQTQAVWRQSSRYRLPAIAYANKMDRTSSASYRLTANSVRKKLGCDILPIQMPFDDTKAKVAGIIDLLNMQAEFVGAKSKCIIPEHLGEMANNAREELVGQIADMDEEFANEVLNSESTSDIRASSLKKAIRRCTLLRQTIPLLCGSSKMDVGVNSLLNATVDFLPNPEEKHMQFVREYSPDRLCAMVFKTIFDQHQGILTFVRIYSGHLNVGKKIYNATQSCTEQPLRLLRPAADYYERIDSANLGDIVILTGLKQTRSGDVIVDSKGDTIELQRVHHDISPVNQSLTVPEPILFASIEAPSLSTVKRLETALDCIVREDPSLSVSFNPETNQTVLSGMGDLHLEVTLQRIRSQFGVDARLGSLAITYRELLVSVPEGGDRRIKHETTIKSDTGQTTVTLDVSIHLTADGEKAQMVTFSYRNSEDIFWPSLPPQWIKAIEAGCRRGLNMSGPLLNSSLWGVHLRFHNLIVSGIKQHNILQGALMSCASEVLQKLVTRCGTVVMEPMMAVEVGILSDTEESLLSTVLGDLSRRRAKIKSVDEKDEVGLVEKIQMVLATAPMSELVGYAGDLRKLTSGRAELHLQLECYEPMEANEQQRLLDRNRLS